MEVVPRDPAWPALFKQEDAARRFPVDIESNMDSKDTYIKDIKQKAA